ncbi:hypothetical protein SAMN05660916_03025 [Arthrobacter sp. 31Cvi3.1E]|nr:hypothetical protein SAMN05660916_03025 [Arthrobacter sp. 31Cvi3.1E]
MTIGQGTWDKTADELQRIVDDIDAGAVDSTPEQRAFLIGAIIGLQDHDDDPQPLPELSEDAMRALCHEIKDLQERMNAGEYPATEEERSCLNRFASHLDQSDVSGGYPVDDAGSGMDTRLAAPSGKGAARVEPQNAGLAERDGGF